MEKERGAPHLPPTGQPRGRPDGWMDGRESASQPRITWVAARSAVEELVKENTDIYSHSLSVQLESEDLCALCAQGIRLSSHSKCMQ